MNTDMKKEDKELKEWLLHYIKNRDILLKQIESINEKSKEWDIVVKTKSGIEKYYLVGSDLDNIAEIIKKIDGKTVILVVLNKKKNLEVVIENWDKIKNNPLFSIMFVNPKSELEKKWILFPHTHEKVTEKASLSKGLNALFQTVDSVY